MRRRHVFQWSSRAHGGRPGYVPYGQARRDFVMDRLAVMGEAAYSTLRASTNSPYFSAGVAGAAAAAAATQDMAGRTVTPQKRTRTEQGYVPGASGSSSYEGGVTKNTEQLGGITATGRITGGNSAAPLTIKVMNGGTPWLTSFKDRRTDKYDKLFSPYWFYTYLRPNKFTASNQDNSAVTTVREQTHEIAFVQDYHAGKIEHMGRITPAVTTNNTTSTQSSTGWQGINSSMNGWGTAYSDAVFKVPLTQKRLTFRNTGNRRAKVMVYEFTCIQNTKGDVNGVQQLWDRYLSRKEIAAADKAVLDNYDTTITGEVCQPLIPRTKQSIGSRPICKDVSEFWKCTGKMNAYILPGRNIEWVSTLNSRSINKKNLDQYVADGHNCIAGWTTEYVIITHGDAVAGYNEAVSPEIEISAKSDYKLVYCWDEQFVTQYTWKVPAVKHYITSSLINGITPAGGIPHSVVKTSKQKGVLLTDTALQDDTTDPFNAFEFVG